MRFVDTSFWVALLFSRAAWHDAARVLNADRSQALLTTNLVVGETWTFLRRRIDHATAVRFVRGVQSSPLVTIRPIDSSIETEAWIWLARHYELVYSFVDATSFAVMRQTRLTEALAFDGDFSAASFIEIRP